MLGKVVHQNQKDWDDRLQPVMAAYRAAKHESTGFSPNQLVLGRENRAPIDLVLGKVVEERQHYDSYDDYVQQVQHRVREAHALAREHLGVAAERRKNEYDIKVKPSGFRPGQWVWYFYPRRYVKRSPKWSKNYDGPFLITNVIPPCDYVIQRTRRSTPQVVHSDKLKLCHCETPVSWLSENGAEQRLDDKNESPVEHTRKLPRRQIRQNDDVSMYNVDFDEEMETRKLPMRQRKMPARFLDYYM